MVGGEEHEPKPLTRDELLNAYRYHLSQDNPDDIIQTLFNAIISQREMDQQMFKMAKERYETARRGAQKVRAEDFLINFIGSRLDQLLKQDTTITREELAKPLPPKENS